MFLIVIRFGYFRRSTEGIKISNLFNNSLSIWQFFKNLVLILNSHELMEAIKLH